MSSFESVTWLAVLCWMIAAVPLLAQTPRPATLRIVVRDATGLTIHGAAVTVTAGSGGAPRTVPANERGEAIFENLAPADYVARVDSPGFTPADIRDLRVRAGSQTSRNVSLVIASLAEEIDVSPPAEDTQLLDAFTEELTAEQIAALPDDPEELAQVLQQLVGDNADIRVNGFAGGRLPPGTQIQDIRVRYDRAPGSGNGGPRIEVRTGPGSGRWQNTFNMNMRDDSLNARNAFSGGAPGRDFFGADFPAEHQNRRQRRARSCAHEYAGAPCRHQLQPERESEPGRLGVRCSGACLHAHAVGRRDSTQPPLDDQKAVDQ